MATLKDREIEFKIEEIFNISPEKGADKIFAGRVTKGVFKSGDILELELDDKVLIITVVWCETFRKRLDAMSELEGEGAICVKINQKAQLECYLKKNGWSSLRGSVIRGLAVSKINN